MLKTILRKVLARAYLNQEEMTTALFDTESVLNSRRLTYITEDPDKFIALPPSVPDLVSTKTDHQDPLVRRSRYGRILKTTKT
ncbi:hypothetical protein TNIN_47511 [Trichonephila inaurata madagascariensis]|uniref:Uncharacterized protein n=1 Tax=Trichonephila inaurata madagascariensis TaxID=2747483 RepID=A0A8X7C8C5_9ARAC|nr:hypothetical protein TNIN_47511 [Trichonephila inaurata madagascariensis]